MAVFKFAVGLLALLLVSAWAEEVEVRDWLITAPESSESESDRLSQAHLYELH